MQVTGFDSFWGRNVCLSCLKAVLLLHSQGWPPARSRQPSTYSFWLSPAFASEQGWRRSMEDAHITLINLGDKADKAMFGVFDGHGGRCPAPS